MSSWFHNLRGSSSSQSNTNAANPSPFAVEDDEPPPPRPSRRDRGRGADPPSSPRNSSSYYRSMRDDTANEVEDDQRRRRRQRRSRGAGRPLSPQSHNSRGAPLTTSPRPTSPPRTTTTTTSPVSSPSSAAVTNYRGFSTSIGDMFVDPQHERVDCCAMTCCGVFQTDRDRYLLQGVMPPSPGKRFWVHLILPFVLFVMAGLAAIHVRDVLLNEFLCLLCLGLLIAGLMAQCSKGRAKRTDIRKDVLWYKYQLLQHRHDMSIDQILDQTQRPEGDGTSPEDTYYYMGQTPRDIGCSHPYCFALGCYATDRPVQLTAANRGVQVEESLCSCLFKTFCRPICGMHIQLGGICGQAQESRELEMTLLPPAYRRIDYITMQPMLQYFEGIYNQRWRNFNDHSSPPELLLGSPTVVGPFSEWPCLSQLSKTILISWAGLTVFLGVWSVAGPLFWTKVASGEGRRHYFGVSDFIIYLCTWFANSIVFLVVIYLTKKQKQLELSIDAMVKYFAAGFFLSTTLSIMYEIIMGLTLRLVILVFMIFSGIDIVEDNSYSLQEWAQAPLTLGFGENSIIHTMQQMGNPYAAAAANEEDSYFRVFGRDHPFLYSFYIFINAYILAALIEEICKYFGYRMMQHPDVNLTQQDLEQAARAGVGERVEGGVDHHVDEDDDYSDEDNNNNNNGARVVGSSATRRRISSRRRMDFSRHGKSQQAQGASITVCMVCVAIGFSVCEDLVYIFLYHGSSVGNEIFVLLIRTMFPIHPICAALQSIGVTERDVEKMPTRFGRILLPAVLFHGTYDFFIIWLDFIDSLYRSDGYNDTDDEMIEAGPCFYISLGLSVISMALALYWYYKQSKLQRERLASYDADPVNTFSRMP